MINQIKKELKKYSSKEDAVFLQRFFKTGPGQYGEGDVFIGVRVPNTRKVAKMFKDLNDQYVKQLVKSSIHEERLLGLIIWVERFKKAEEIEREKIFNLYISHVKYVNNWDLVDLSAPYLVGGYLFDNDRSKLYSMVQSKDLWERRISIIGTFHFIRKNDFHDTIKLSEILLTDEHDLIHKAVGWMLREVGKRDEKVLEGFLNNYYTQMPRTMLRYAIERLSKDKKAYYMRKNRFKEVKR